MGSGRRRDLNIRGMGVWLSILANRFEGTRLFFTEFLSHNASAFNHYKVEKTGDPPEKLTWGI